MTSFGDKVELGRTGLRVSRLGLGSSYGVSERSCLEAFDAGVNYFFWGSVRTVSMGLAIRQIAKRSRDQLVVAFQCYTRSPSMLTKSIEKGLAKAKLDYADVVILGWHDTMPAARTVETALELKERGRFRFLGLSSHQRPLIQSLLDDPKFDLFHVRYNAAHRGAEREIFAHLPDEQGPGIVSFTNTRWGDLLKPKNMPDGYTAPSATDCYQFVLSSPHVHVAIAGPKNESQTREALAVLRRDPMSEPELERMRTIGDRVHGVRSFNSILT